MATLPDKPSELIEVAIADLEKAERSPRYIVDMSSWHVGEKHASEVCLAGAVMAFSLGCDDDDHLEPSDLPESEKKLYSLDCFRTGHISSGLEYLKLDVPASAQDERGRWFRSVPEYIDGSEEFKAAMREMAADLRELGL